MKSPEKPFEIAKPRRRWLRWLKRVGWSLLALMVIAFCAQKWGHYTIQKRLDQTSAELDRAEPGWRLADIEAAREQIPEDENSARVVVAAARLLPKNWPPQEFDDLFGHLAPEEQLSPDDFARLKHELDKVRPALEEASKLAVMPRGRHRIAYQRNPFDTLLPDQQNGHRVARLLVLDALHWNQEGNAQQALISCRAALNTARALGDEPNLVALFVRAADGSQACHAVERTLAQGEPPSAEMIALQELLEKEDAFPDLLTGARGERAADQELFDAVESGDVTFTQLRGGKSVWGERLFGFLYRDVVRTEHPIMLARMSQWVAIVQLPSHEQAEAERQFLQEIGALPKTTLLFPLLLPGVNKVGEVSRRKHAYLRCMAATLAAERYRHIHKSWPDSLDKLSPEYLPFAPLDPFDGQPLRHRRIDDGVRIYSVGNDGIDNGGNLDREHPNLPRVDIGYRLWDVAKRRQPPRPKPAEPPGPMPPPWMPPPNPG